MGGGVVLDIFWNSPSKGTFKVKPMSVSWCKVYSAAGRIHWRTMIILIQLENAWTCLFVRKECHPGVMIDSVKCSIGGFHMTSLRRNYANYNQFRRNFDVVCEVQMKCILLLNLKEQQKSGRSPFTVS